MKSCPSKLLPAVLCAALLPAAHAADISFPGTSGDLSDAASWGGTFPSAADRPLFYGTQQKAFNVTASADVSFAGIIFDFIEWSNATFDLRDSASGGDAAGGAPRTVTLSDSITTSSNANRYRAWFKGGKWNVTGNLDIGSFAEVTAQDGAVMNFSGNIQPAGGATGQFIATVTGSGTSVTAAKALTQISGGYAGGNTIAVRDGASLTLTGGSASDPAIKTGEQGGDNNAIVVSGSGASLVVQNNALAWIGSGKGGTHSLRVEDGGEFSMGGELRIGSVNNQASIHHSVTVTGSGSTLAAGTVTVGYGSAGWDWATAPHDARFIVADGAVATVSDRVWVGYSTANTTWSPGNSMVVSNATFRSTNFPMIGNRIINSNNVLRVIGPDARFEAYVNDNATDCSFFQVAPYGLFEIDGASVTNNVAANVRLVSANLAAGRNTFRLQNKAEFHATGAFSISGPLFAAPSNTVEILSGSRLHSQGNVTAYSEGNRYVVDDGILETAGNITVTPTASTSVPLGNGQSPNEKNELCVGGANGQVLAENGTISIARQSTLRFMVPVDGYAAGIVPVKARTITISDDSAIAVDGADLRAVNKNLNQSETVTLATATSSLSVPQTVLDAANAELKGFAKLAVDGNSLKLRISALNSPLIIYIR